MSEHKTLAEHKTLIRQAIELASLAREHGNHPFGALLARGGEVLLTAENTVHTGGDPTQHAEMNLVSDAWRKLTREQIQGSTLYTSTEPCPMCSGAVFWSGIRRLVYSFPATELAGMTGDTFCSSCQPLFDRADEKTEIIGPILPKEGRRPHDKFWRSQAGPDGFWL